MRKAAFVKFAECGKDVQGAEGERLRRLAGPDGKQEYAGFVQQPQRCLLEVMEAFPSVHPPLGRPLPQPRIWLVLCCKPCLKHHSAVLCPMALIS